MEGRIILLIFVSICGVYSQDNSRVWTIGVGDDWGAHEYRDMGGYVKGFGLDFLDMVCQEGRLDCRMVWNPYQYCWNSTGGLRPAAGPAIYGRWVDGCAGWAVTVERIHAVKFTLSWMKKISHYFFVKRGDSLDLNNLNGKRIGFVNGWAANEQCVARALTPLDPSQMLHLDTSDQLLDALNNGQINAVFSTEPGWTAEQSRQLTKINTSLFCTLAGTSIMARKDSAFPAVFNNAFNKIKNTPKFPKFCEEANARHTSGTNKIECVN